MLPVQSEAVYAYLGESDGKHKLVQVQFSAGLGCGPWFSEMGRWELEAPHCFLPRFPHL